MAKPYFKPLDRPEREEIWYCYYVPDRRKAQNAPRIAQVPISQVPDLTNATRAYDVSAQETISNRARIRETDSRYVKLAKSGGRKNLLCYHENERGNTGAKNYKVPEWYYHDGHGPVWRPEDKKLSEDEAFKKCNVTYGKPSYKPFENSTAYKRPDYMTHLDPREIFLNLDEPARVPDRPIFGYDTYSVWERNELEKRPHRLPSLVEEGRKVQSAKRSAKKDKQTTNKVKLPAHCKTQLPGHERMVNSDYATHWYDKWYVRAVRG